MTYNQEPAQSGGRPLNRYWLAARCLFGLMILSCGFVPVTKITDDGERDTGFRFQLTDARTAKPLAGATITLYHDISRKQYDLTTDNRGEATVSLPCATSCTTRAGLLWSTTRRSIYYPNLVLFAWKRGHKQLGPLYLEDLVGRWHVDDRMPPPPVHLELDPD
jgi:hypothetical protein